jgi:membrane-bound lytic murein transglycosylase F
VRAAHPEVRWAPLGAPSAESLIAEVSDGKLDYAIVGSNEAAVSRNIYLNYDVAFAAGGRRELAWAVAPSFAKLRDDLDRFFARARRDGTLARLTERYVTHVAEVQRIDADIFQQRIRTMLPAMRPLFHEAQEASGIEWRLLAAVAYQESQWDPIATSETGARGLMQLTEETARHLGVIDRLDPRTALLAGARYLRKLKDRIPERIGEPDRTWLALAAFNIGLGHLEDARILAQKQQLDPDAWSDVKKALPLLAQPEYFEQAKLGYARGGMPVAFVDRVRAYYDVLLAHQPPHTTRLRAYAADDTGMR